MKEKKNCHFCGNNLIKKDIDGRVRLFCNNCYTPIYENPIPATSAVIIREDSVLLVKRGVEPHKGEWCLPGGFMELDESPEEACLRELKEETNLVGHNPVLQGVYRSNNPFYTTVSLVGYSIQNYDGELKAGDDCVDTGYFNFDNLPKIPFRSHRKLLKDTMKNLSIFSTKKLSNFGAYVITSGDHLKMTEDACSGGANIIQLRDKKMTKEDLHKTAMAMRKITRKSHTLLIINDHLDIALISDADGVHLGQEDLSISMARKISPKGFIIGKSTHSLKQAIKAEKDGADYIGIGPVYKTPTKKDYSPIGIPTAEKVINKIKIPIVAIGGIDFDNIDNIIQLGFSNIAMVRQFQNNTADVVKKLNNKLKNNIY